MKARTVLLPIILALALALWAQSPSKPQPDKKPVLLQEVELPDGRCLRFWMKEIVRGVNLWGDRQGYVEIRGELVDPTTKAAKQLCNISYYEFPVYALPWGDPQFRRPPEKPPRNFVVAMKDSTTLGLAFTVYPYWAEYFRGLTDFPVPPACGPRPSDLFSWWTLDAAFLELDLNAESAGTPPDDPACLDPRDSRLASQAGRYSFYDETSYDSDHMYLEQGVGFCLSCLLTKHFPRPHVLRLLEEDKLRLRSLKYEKDRWILQGELGDHGFEITLREFVEMTQAEAVRIKEPWRVIRWGVLEPDPRLPPPLLVELNKIWRLR